MAQARVAIVHDWLTGMRGGEKVLEAICELYPDAALYTMLRVPGSVSPEIERRRIRTSPAQWLPAAGRLYRHYLPTFPTMVELFDLDERAGHPEPRDPRRRHRHVVLRRTT